MADLPKALSQALWIATENIARFQALQKTTVNRIDHQMLEATLAFERDKLALLSLEVRAWNSAKHVSPQTGGAET